MKKINFKKILITVLWIIGLSGLLTSMAFATKKEKQVITENLLISVNNTELNSFIDEEDIKEFFKERKDSILNTEVEKVNVNKLEKVLNSHPAVENSEVAIDINGDITINVTQRTPLVRVINITGESYYIDTQAKVMPLNDNYTARVIVATGHFNEPFVNRNMISIDAIAKHKKISELSVLDDIYSISSHIAKDSVLSSLIHQINITKEKEIELYPSIGNQKIIFGDLIDVEEKLNKLKIFYKEGLNKTDSWNKYSIINIKYKNQVVCTKI
jgi:cell division protein FtsQ